MALNTIILNWQDNSSNETGFKIYKSTDGVTFTLLATLGVGIITYTATEIVSGQQYWFRVLSYNDAGDSSYVQVGPISCDWRPILSYDKKKDELYITRIDTAKTYILNKQGMGMIEGYVYGIVPDNVGRRVIGKVQLSTVNPEVEIISDIIDLGVAGIKCIETIDIGVICNTEVQVAIDYRMNKSDVYTTSVYKIVNSVGNVFFNIRTIDFKVRVKAVNPNDFVLNYIRCGIQYVDKRGRRGVDTPME